MFSWKQKTFNFYWKSKQNIKVFLENKIKQNLIYVFFSYM